VILQRSTQSDARNAAYGPIILIHQDTLDNLLIWAIAASLHMAHPGSSDYLWLGHHGNSYRSLKRSYHHHGSSNRPFKWELSAWRPGDGFFGAFYTSSNFLVNVLHPVSMSAPPGDPVVVNRCQAIYINYLSIYNRTGFSLLVFLHSPRSPAHFCILILLPSLLFTTLEEKAIDELNSIA
jgi:hypothetical protein